MSGTFGKPNGEFGTIERANEEDAVVKWDDDGRTRLGALISFEEHTSMMPRPAAKVSFNFKYLRHSDMASVLITTFEIFTRVGPNNSLERLTERSVGLITDRPGNVDELLITLLEELHRLLHSPLRYIFQWCLFE